MNVKVKEALEKSTKWLVLQQVKRGEGEEGGWGGQPGHRPNTLNTAEALIALVKSGQNDAETRDAIESAKQYLVKHQIGDGKDKGAWPREPTSQNKLPDVVRTAYAVIALLTANLDLNTSALQQGIRWLLEVQKKDAHDKGWQFRGNGANSEVFPTCLALRALIEAYRYSKRDLQFHNDIRDSIESGITTLLRKHRDDRDGGKKTNFGRGEYSPVHTLYATLVLQEARNAGLDRNEYLEAEKIALSWLLEQNQQILEPITERISIDPNRGNPAWDYDFIHLTDALVLQILKNASSDIAEKPGFNKLNNDALNCLAERWDQRNGGFYASCHFSWATAKSIYALGVLGGDKDFRLEGQTKLKQWIEAIGARLPKARWKIPAAVIAAIIISVILFLALALTPSAIIATIGLILIIVVVVIALSNSIKQGKFGMPHAMVLVAIIFILLMLAGYLKWDQVQEFLKAILNKS